MKMNSKKIYILLLLLAAFQTVTCSSDKDDNYEQITTDRNVQADTTFSSEIPLDTNENSMLDTGGSFNVENSKSSIEDTVQSMSDVESSGNSTSGCKNQGIIYQIQNPETYKNYLEKIVTLAEDNQDECGPISVTGIFTNGKNKGFSVQYAYGGEYSGIFIYTGEDAPTVKVGDIVSLSGKYIEFPFDKAIPLETLSEIKDIELLSSTPGSDLEATVVNPRTLGNEDLETEKWEGVLVKIENIRVIDTNPDEPDDFGEFVVTGGIRIDDYSNLSWGDMRTMGYKFESITGVLHFSYDHYKIIPRTIQDLVPAK